MSMVRYVTRYSMRRGLTWRPLNRRMLTGCVVAVCLWSGSATAVGIDDLLDVDLATLMDMEVVTPARKGQTVFEAPASVSVISREMILRRGYRSLEDVLMDVPGFDFTSGQPAGEYPTHFLYRGISDVG